MQTLLQFIARIAVVLYALAGAGIFFALRTLFRARRARRIAVFGLEREAARQMLSRSLSTVVLLVLLILAVYIIQNVVVPNMQGVAEEPSPTPVVFVEPQPTPTAVLLLFPTVTPTVGLPPAEVGAETPTTPEPANGCEIIGSTITSPQPGDAVSGQVAVQGEANILDFAGYKFEVMGPSTGGAWVVVGAYSNPVPVGLLGVWDSTSLLPGSYTLRLVTFRQDGTFLVPCEVPIVINAPALVSTPAP